MLTGSYVLPVGAGEPRQRRAATQDDPMRRAAERQAMREELSRLWEGLLDAQQGDCMVRHSKKDCPRRPFGQHFNCYSACHVHAVALCPGYKRCVWTLVLIVVSTIWRHM